MRGVRPVATSTCSATTRAAVARASSTALLLGAVRLGDLDAGADRRRRARVERIRDQLAARTAPASPAGRRGRCSVTFGAEARVGGRHLARRRRRRRGSRATRAPSCALVASRLVHGSISREPRDVGQQRRAIRCRPRRRGGRRSSVDRAVVGGRPRTRVHAGERACPRTRSMPGAVEPLRPASASSQSWVIWSRRRSTPAGRRRR